MASATSTVNMWGLGYSMLARKQSWTFARFELLGKNLKGHHHSIDAPGFNSLDVVPGEGVPCLFDVSQSRFQGHWVKTAWHQIFAVQRRIIRPKDCNSWMGWLRSTVPNSNTPKLHPEKDQRENYQVVWKTEATFRPTWLASESIINSLQFQLLTDFVLWFFQASNEIQAVLQTFPKHSLIAAAWLK